ncbi:sensor histidine kinase [Streptomyces cylindrosporus]|uniref:histidine kinase n=1 Tax=Streptomyces cylindrosporus TaxID=2927583 RepID=A0ABS9Y4X6_9ACTN|nr:sensor histidine kinase [Streptomyces cylindrosporus]MCI3272258.1 ATP-binding protein [Streptomyces cylindrosporus]
MTAPTLPGERPSLRSLAPVPLLTAVLAALAVAGAVALAPRSQRVALGLGAGIGALLLCVAVTVATRAVVSARITRRRLEAVTADTGRLLQDRIRQSAEFDRERARLTEELTRERGRLAAELAHERAVLSAEFSEERARLAAENGRLAERARRADQERATAISATANAAGRMQALATGMLADLRAMEERHDDEDVLADLLHLDHRTAQAGRLADSVAVLAGARSGRRWARPIGMESILRGAMGRISGYRRVRVHSASEAAVAGHAAEGVMHALAELLDNAANFSPPTAEVHVYVEEVPAGVIVSVEDSGLVMGDVQLRRAERAVSGDETDLGGLTGTRLGLAVVGRLSRKYGLKVSYRPSARGGTGVLMLIPQDILVPEQYANGNGPREELTLARVGVGVGVGVNGRVATAGGGPGGAAGGRPGSTAGGGPGSRAGERPGSTAGGGPGSTAGERPESTPGERPGGMAGGRLGAGADRRLAATADGSLGVGVEGSLGVGVDGSLKEGVDGSLRAGADGSLKAGADGGQEGSGSGELPLLSDGQTRNPTDGTPRMPADGKPWVSGDEPGAGSADGRARGVANAHAQGSADGHARVLYDGHAPGAADGHAPGSADGLASGPHNGHAPGSPNRHARVSYDGHAHVADGEQRSGGGPDAVGTHESSDRGAASLGEVLPVALPKRRRGRALAEAERERERARARAAEFDRERGRTRARAEGFDGFGDPSSSTGGPDSSGGSGRSWGLRDADPSAPESARISLDDPLARAARFSSFRRAVRSSLSDQAPPTPDTNAHDIDVHTAHGIETRGHAPDASEATETRGRTPDTPEAAETRNRTPEAPEPAAPIPSHQEGPTTS